MVIMERLTLLGELVVIMVSPVLALGACAAITHARGGDVVFTWKDRQWRWRGR